MKNNNLAGMRIDEFLRIHSEAELWGYFKKVECCFTNSADEDAFFLMLHIGKYLWEKKYPGADFMVDHKELFDIAHANLDEFNNEKVISFYKTFKKWRF